MSRTKKILIAVGAALVIAIPAVAVSAQGGIGDDDTPITGEALEKASEAALTHIGEGRVTDTEIEDEESYYEVEVTRDDGSQVDVQLDEDFNVVGTEDDGSEDDEGSDEGSGDDAGESGS